MYFPVEPQKAAVNLRRASGNNLQGRTSEGERQHGENRGETRLLMTDKHRSGHKIVKSFLSFALLISASGEEPNIARAAQTLTQQRLSDSKFGLLLIYSSKSIIPRLKREKYLILSCASRKVRREQQISSTVRNVSQEAKRMLP